MADTANGAQAGEHRLILILSSERSGSTLTRVLLGQHSRIVAPQEMFLLRYPDYDTFRREKAVAIESLVELFDILGRPRSVEELDATLAGMTTPEAYEWLLGQLPAGARLLDKTPAYANDGDTLRRSRMLRPFYIWLIRHPLGVIESHVRIKREARAAAGGWAGLRHRVRDRLVGLAATAQGGMTPLARQRETKWVVQQTIIREFLASVAPEDQVAIRFEDLVRDPGTVVARLCEGLGLEVEPGMLEVIGERRTMNVSLGDPNFHKHDRVDPATADGWRAVFSEDALTLETRRLMERIGVRR
jgi:hypothetical protein